MNWSSLSRAFNLAQTATTGTPLYCIAFNRSVDGPIDLRMIKFALIKTSFIKENK